MAANRGAIDHVLPVVGQAQIDQRLQQRIPNALPGPASEPDIDRVPLAIALVHVAPGAAHPQNMQHAIEKTTVVARWPRPATTLRRQQRSDQFPFRIRQITTAHDCSPKSSLESELNPFGNPFCQHGLVYVGLRAVTSLRVGPAVAVALAIAFGVEVAQALNLITTLGLENVQLARTVLGTSFAWGDLAAYGAGAVMVLIVEQARKAV